MAYIKHFQKTAILTSQNPAAIFTFKYGVGNPSYWIRPSYDVSTNALIANGVYIDSSAASKRIALMLNSEQTVASFQLYTPVFFNFDVSVHFYVYDSSIFSGSPLYTESVNVLNRPNIIKSGEINVFDNDAPLIENEASYALLRTNPKFSGNIKIVADENGNIYLDTFKVSQILSNRLYRKQQVSANSVFSGDVNTIFKSLPVGELYKLDVQDPLNIAIPKVDINQQYSTTYNYGARLLKDDLYSEDYALLAPLWINSKLPDYFAIFRLNGVYNNETYTPPIVLDNLAAKYFEQSDLIKSWSIKSDQPLGKYLTNHLNELLQNPSPVYLSLNQYDPNTWYGIAVNKGIIAGRSEVPYFFNQIASNFTHMNAWVSGGFERQNLLCPNLINLEYVFSDTDVSMYSMHRYFGLYLSENELYKIAYYADSENGNIQILSLDEKDSSAFIHSPLFFDVSGNITSKYKNRIFVLNDGEKLHRITNVSQINGEEATVYLNKTKDNIFNIPVVKKTYNPFITIKLNERLEQGDHFRVISKSQNKAWEAYGVGNELINAGECWPYASVSDPCSNHVLLHRVAFSASGSISDQVKALEKAFDTFSLFEENPPFRVGTRTDDMFSIILNENSSTNDFMFQRITSNNRPSTFGSISLFGVHTTTESDYVNLDVSAFYGPIDFEFYGTRKTVFCDFIWTSNFLHSLSDSVANKIENYTFYQGIDGWYRTILNFDVSTQSTNNLYKYVYDPLSLTKEIVVMSKNDIKTVNNWWNAYNIKPLSISLMGINSVKDIDYTVYDASHGIEKKSDYWYAHDDDEDTHEKSIMADEYSYIEEKNSYNIVKGVGTITIDGSTRSYSNPTSLAPFAFNTFNASAYILASEPTTIKYCMLNGSTAFVSYDSNLSEENFYDYYANYNTINASIYNPNNFVTAPATLKYSLTVPQVSKWAALGNDCRNNPLRLILKNLYSNNSVKTNFIPLDSSNFRSEISYPSFKYLSAGGNSWKDYVYYDISDVVEYEKDGETLNTTIKNLMFEEPYLDVFSKLMYSNHDVVGAKTRSSILYYNQFKQSIDTISQGLSFSFRVQSVASTLLNIKNYDRYRFGFISTASRNYSNNRPIEVIINENTKSILMIWYQGNDILSYSKRNSSKLSGVSHLIESDKNINFQSFSKADVSIYSYVKTPFYLNTGENVLVITNAFLNNASFNEMESSPLLQQAYNTRNYSGSVINAYGLSYHTTNNKTFSGYVNSVYTTFTQETIYAYIPKSNTTGRTVINHAYKYSSNENLYKNSTCDIDMLKYLLNYQLVYPHIFYHIIRGENIYNSDLFASSPIYLSINTPSNYNINNSPDFYTYNGWYIPEFNNILEFNYNEDEDIINTVEKDFALSNTNLESYNNIPQYWYNKVVTAVTNTDVSTKNAIGLIQDYNVFKAQWDEGYYIKDGSTSVNGYVASQELPSFFGSKLVKLPESIILNSWNSSLTTASYANQTVTLTFNLSKGIQTLFKNNEDFLNNWIGLPNYTESDIDNYIINTILTYYNISFSKIKLKAYTKVGPGIINYEYSNDMVETNQNFDSQLSIINGDYIYEIKINNVYNNYLEYYVQFTLFEL